MVFAKGIGTQWGCMLTRILDLYLAFLEDREAMLNQVMERQGALRPTFCTHFGVGPLTSVGWWCLCRENKINFSDYNID